MRLPAPRWQTPLPDGVAGSWGPLVIAYAERVLHIRLDRWQRRAINRALVVGADGRLLHRHYLISAGRQSGKTAVVRALIGWALTTIVGPDWQTLLGLAYDRGQARIPYKAVLADLRPLRDPRLSLTMYLGIRSDVHGWHREYDVASREAPNAIRSLSVDLAVFDEIRTQRNYDVWAALEPTTRARLEALILAISSAGDDRSVLLHDWWERGLRIIAGDEPADGFGMTWYAAADEDAATPDPATTAGRRAILAANPAVAEGRVPFGPVAASFRSLTASKYREETLNLWSEGVDELLPPGLWRQRIAAQPDASIGQITLGVDVAPSWRRATIAVGVETADGAWIGIAGEIDAVRAGAGAVRPDELQDRVLSLARAWRPNRVAYSGAAAAAEHIRAAVETARVQAVPLTGRQVRAASDLWRSELIAGRLTHEDDPLMGQQVRTARPNHPLDGGDWYLSVVESTGDIDAVRAGAWAAYAAIAPEVREVPLQIFP